MRMPSDLEVSAAVAALRANYPQKAIRSQFGETVLALSEYCWDVSNAEICRSNPTGWRNCQRW